MDIKDRALSFEALVFHPDIINSTISVQALVILKA